MNNFIVLYKLGSGKRKHLVNILYNLFLMYTFKREDLSINDLNEYVFENDLSDIITDEVVREIYERGTFTYAITPRTRRHFSFHYRESYMYSQQFNMRNTLHDCMVSFINNWPYNRYVKRVSSKPNVTEKKNKPFDKQKRILKMKTNQPRFRTYSWESFKHKKLADLHDSEAKQIIREYMYGYDED